VKASAEVQFGIGSAGASVEANVDKEFKENFEASTVRTMTYATGGSAEATNAVHMNPSAANYQAWTASVTDNQTWCDYYNSAYSLAPITDFIADATKKGAIQGAINAYLEGKKINVVAGQPAPPLGPAEFEDDFEINLAEQGNATNIHGDNSVNTQKGHDTKFEMYISGFSNANSSTNQIKFNAQYTVTEQKGDYSTLRISKSYSYALPTGRKLVAVQYPQNAFSLAGIITGVSHDYNVFNNQGGFITSSFRVDGTTSDERGDIGYKVKFRIHYKYTNQ
jgi:hypothetical protein